MKRKINILGALLVVAASSTLCGCNRISNAWSALFGDGGEKKPAQQSQKPERTAIPAGPWHMYEVYNGIVVETTDRFGGEETGTFIRLYARLRARDRQSPMGSEEYFVLVIKAPTAQQAQDFCTAAQGKFLTLLDPSSEDRYETLRKGRIYNPTDWGNGKENYLGNEHRIIQVHNWDNVRLENMKRVTEWVKPDINTYRGKDLLREDIHSGDVRLFDGSLEVRKRLQEEAKRKGVPIPPEP